MDPLENFQHYGLSPREIEILPLVAEGKTNKEIGIFLNISFHTVTKHLEHIYTKLGVNSRTATTAWFLGIMHQGNKKLDNGNTRRRSSKAYMGYWLPDEEGTGINKSSITAAHN